MNMTRRAFTKLMGSGALFARFGSFSAAILAAGASNGCGAAMAVIAAFIPVGLTAFSSVLALLGDPGTSQLVLLIKAGFVDLAADVKAYDSTTPSPVGALQKVDDVLSLIAGNIQQYMASVTVPSMLEIIVTGFIATILSAIAGFLQLFPAPAAMAKTKAVFRKSAFVVNGKRLTIVPKQYKNALEMKEDLNAIAVGTGHPEMAQHISFGERVGTKLHVTKK